ncbi:winged helix-turn-helix transcriptional regulator [Streptomyces althioticus]|uniref:Helix-turn-helix domain-containing protein n=2 Tax=Streptomyces althioticus group TaxID=2867194 RepID=A0ABU3I2N8_9ACTN|nr:helix-turn-helix domain-containing protein [Streptomyces griseorubens]ALV53863.1 MarR family transcriptional regulator [Streptomyces sp. 4F]MCC9689994.1 helix-turn-helix transcriptional regulator [Streptomyces sp. MNU103]MDT3727222.1 helix-turn-helix domain-containing protein [Streptomyces sp. DSM 41972]SCD58512.1 transcriptional regulator, HxlR family [Streptomyces sp. di50b]SCE23953.1 transcriptional regulator, HxlR family [Streptomyces sp. di188]
MPETDDARASGELRIENAHRELLDQVLDKWSLSVLNELCERPCRFNDLRRAIPTVTQKSLTATLRRLERNGIVEREVVSSRPVAVEYRITPLGKTMRRPVDVLLEWATAHMPEIERARDAFDDGLD